MEDLTSIYAVSSTIFKAETLRARNIQDNTLNELIKKALKNDQVYLIKEAIEKCNQNDKYKERNLIIEHYSNLINTLYINEEMINSRTDLILFPIILKSKEEVVKIINFKKIEEFFEQMLKETSLIPVASNLHLYSVFLDQEKIHNMDFSEWYNLHQKIVFSRNKSIAQKIYNNNFGVAVTPNKPELFYFIGLIHQNRKLVEPVDPDLFDRRQMNLDDKKKFLQESQKFVSTFSSRSNYEIILPDYPLKVIQEARYHYQSSIINYFVEKEAKQGETEFIIFPLEEHIGLCVFDVKTNKVINSMKLLSYGSHDDKENIDSIFDSLANKKIYVYISNNTQPNNFWDNIENINIQEFLNNNEHEKFMPNTIDNSDFYL